MSEFMVFGAPQIEEAEIAEVEACLRSGWLGTGPRVAKFEAEFGRYKGIEAAQVAAVNSCTAALHVAMIAAGLAPGDEVITTPLTFCASVNAIIHAGLTPVLADIDPATQNIDPRQIEARLTPRTRAILPVHMAGRACEMDAIAAIAQARGLVVIEDCAHAIETEYRGRKAGTLGQFGCFSFYVTKNVACGEGGMVIAQAVPDIDRVKILALHGMSKDAWKRFSDSGYNHYQVVECGFKYNMMDLQAAIGLHQLARVERNWLRRREIWAWYQRELADLPLRLPAEPAPDTRHAHHLYTVGVEKQRAGIDRDTFLTRMTAERVGVGVHYMSIPEHPYYKARFGWQPEHYPHAMAIGRSTVSLPLSARLSDADCERVVASVRRALANHART